MSRKRTGRSQEEMAKTLSYMVFDFDRGWLCGPDHPSAGKPVYWNTGGLLPAAWTAEALRLKRNRAMN